VKNKVASYFMARDVCMNRRRGFWRLFINCVSAGGAKIPHVSLELPHPTFYRLPHVQLQLPYGLTFMSRSWQLQYCRLEITDC